MSFDWKNTLQTIAPTIATALGGPLAGNAVKFLGEAVLGKPEATEQDLASYISGASPEQLAELKRLDQEFEVRMRELDIDVYEIDAKDRASARELFKVNKWPQIILSGLFVCGYFIILGLLISGEIEIQEAIKDTAILLLGVLTREVPTIMQFWFGSSVGSKEKDQYKLGKNNQP